MLIQQVHDSKTLTGFLNLVFKPWFFHINSFATLLLILFFTSSLQAQSSHSESSYKDHTDAQAKEALKSILRERGLEQMLVDLEPRKLFLHPKLVHLTTKTSRKNAWFHLNFAAYSRNDEFKEQFDPIARELLEKTCNDPEFLFLMEQGVKITYTFEGPDNLALGGFEIISSTCKKI